MALLDWVKTTPIHRPWRAWREGQQIQRFEDLLQGAGGVPGFDVGMLAARLRARAHGRRPLQAPLHVVAFGTNDWEQHGLWPALQRLGSLSLFDYLAQGARPEGDPAPVRDALGHAFLRFLDEAERSGGPVHLAFLYAAGFHLSPAVLSELSRRGIWTVLLSLDDKQQLPGPRRGSLEGWQLEAARSVDVYWTTWRGGVDWLAGQGANPWYAPEAADPALFRPVETCKDIDVLWIGRAYGPRLGLVETLRRCGLAVHVAGPGWPGGAVSFEEMIRLVSRARLVLGMGGVGHTDKVKHLKGRDFEVPMCGAAYLTSFNPELTDFFTVGSEILCYGSPQECADVARWGLARPERLVEIGAAARRRSTEEHTWDRRLAQLLRLLGWQAEESRR